MSKGDGDAFACVLAVIGCFIAGCFLLPIKLIEKSNIDSNDVSVARPVTALPPHR